MDSSELILPTSESLYPLSSPKLITAKLLSTPTATAHTHFYHAGNLVALLSLHSDQPEDLNAYGKDVLNTLEEEFFTLEEKHLEQIKQVVSAANEKVPKNLVSCFLVVYITKPNELTKKTVAYILGLGRGKVLLKRHETVGVVFETMSHELTACSGFLQGEDLLILETKAFQENVPLVSVLAKKSLPNDLVDELEPNFITNESTHEAAAFVLYQIPHPLTHELTPLPSHHDLETVQETPPTEDLPIQRQPHHMPHPKDVVSKLTHTRKVYLTIACLLAVVLAAGIFFSIKKQTTDKTQAIMQSVLLPAQKKYDDGEAIKDVNSDLAREDFEQAKQTLDSSIQQVPKNSQVFTQIQTLQQKITDALSNLSSNSSGEAPADPSQTPLLAFELKNPSQTVLTQDTQALYAADAAGITKIDKTSQTKTTIIKNAAVWKSVKGLGQYNGNLYLLDPNGNQIRKFVNNGSGYDTLDYLAKTIDLSRAVSLAIDTSAWVLMDDGTIKKFTRGNPDDFSLQGLSQSFSHPTRILTNTDMANLYILDPQNSRIVVLRKTGSYETQYQTGILKNAIDLDVQEQDKKIFVLSNGKLYQITMK